VAVIFDDTLRPETTGTYCARALQGLVEVTHINPTELGIRACDGFDLYLRIDDGLDYGLGPLLHPSALWAIDTHLNFEACLTRAREFDFVFAAQRDGAEQLRRAGINSAAWLPLAADPDIHCKHDLPKRYDVAFVGNELPGERIELLRLIKDWFQNSFVGQSYFDEMARTYSAARIVFNRSVRNDMNMRVFEALACGSLLITNDLAHNGQSELFKPGVHLETYDGADELIDKVRYYLEHEEARERIAATGRAEVLAKHTYRHRMRVLLERIRASHICLQSAGTSSKHTAAVNPRISCRTHPPASGPRPFRDYSYFDHARPELLALVPHTAQRVLDIGCAAGRLGEAIKARQQAEVTGIERDEAAAARARGRLDRIVVSSLEQVEFETASFDCIICGDILEHLDDTEAVLERAHAWLGPEGCLVASSPNVRHYSLIQSLLDGNWTYESAGLLDHEHVRLFTRKEIERVFRQSGFQINQIQFVPGSGYDEWESQGRPDSVSIGRLHIRALASGDAQEFFVYQFLVVARPKQTAKPSPTVSRDGIKEPRSCFVGHAMPDYCNPFARKRRQFTQNFITDFDEFDFRGEPFAFVRFGDGERAICEGRRVECQDGWTFAGATTPFAADLNASLRFNDPDYFIGISDSCCDLSAHQWLLKQVSVPLSQLTYANIFVNWNYRRFRQLDLNGFAIVANGVADFWVPGDLVCGNYDIDALVTQLVEINRPILLAAGPASCIIAHKYWLRADPARRQTIIDVGSAIDEKTKGHKTRQYQTPGTRTAELICTW
jgi:2-polyprenyl-3-methyl-5-hydroxy-6-metoxy-1,4-benzoquinol methylase